MNQDAVPHSAAPRPDGVSPEPTRFRLVIDYAVEGDIRFLSHNDMVRMFARACARGGLPVCFTRGFNPRRRLALPFPKPVGQSSDVERLLLDLDEALPPAAARNRLAAEMPEGVTLGQAKSIAPSDSSPPFWVRYNMTLAPGEAERVGDKARSLLALESLNITRVRHKDQRSKVVDIRPWIDKLEVRDARLVLSAHVTNLGSVTPAEVCGALGMEAGAIPPRIRRVKIRWQEKQQPNQPLA